MENNGNGHNLVMRMGGKSATEGSLIENKDTITWKFCNIHSKESGKYFI